jgi:putative sigma-54 modulation protein
MKVTLISRNVPLEPADRESIARRALFALGRLAARLAEVKLRLEDLNAERGGIDTRCQATLILRGGGEIIVEARDAEVLRAVGRALERAARRVSESQERRRDLRRGRRGVA